MRNIRKIKCYGFGNSYDRYEQQQQLHLSVQSVKVGGPDYQGYAETEDGYIKQRCNKTRSHSH
jgi:hypothetical protein